MIPGMKSNMAVQPILAFWGDTEPFAVNGTLNGLFDHAAQRWSENLTSTSFLVRQETRRVKRFRDQTNPQRSSTYRVCADWIQAAHYLTAENVIAVSPIWCVLHRIKGKPALSLRQIPRETEP